MIRLRQGHIQLRHHLHCVVAAVGTAGNTSGVAEFEGPPAEWRILLCSIFLSSMAITSWITLSISRVSGSASRKPRFFCTSSCIWSGNPQKNSAHAEYCDIFLSLMRDRTILLNCVEYIFRSFSPFSRWRSASVLKKGIWYILSVEGPDQNNTCLGLPHIHPNCLWSTHFGPLFPEWYWWSNKP